MTSPLAYPPIQHYINGEFIAPDQGKTFPIINPATREVLGYVPCATADILDRALQSASLAFDSWKHSSPMERSRILRQVAQLSRDRVQTIAYHLTQDQGKPLAESRKEVLSCSEHCEWHAEECRRIYGRLIPSRQPQLQQLVVREPVGVCVALTPWNFPYNLAIRKISAAIAAGCTVIVKASEEAPSAVMAIAQAFHDAGLPKGVLNVVWGDPVFISHHLITSPVVNHISFTGSTQVGQQLASLAGQHLKKITMELGGHAPVIVCEDSDVVAVAQQLAQSKIRNAGQACTAPSRFYVHASRYEEFVHAFTQALSTVTVGNGLDPATQMGPLIHDRRVRAMQALVDDALSLGARCLLGGHVTRTTGSFYPPTVLVDVAAQSRILWEEPFGPVSPILPFNTLDEAITLANQTRYGLRAYAFTHHLHNAQQLAQRLACGVININHLGSALPETPFGGIKDSGIGSEGGIESFEGYLTTKFVTQLA